MAQPKIKPVLADFIAKVKVLEGVKFDAYKTIVNGHRGLLSLTENDLIKEFYKVKELICSKDFTLPIINYSHWQHPKLTPKEMTLALREEAAKLEVEIVEKFLLL